MYRSLEKAYYIFVFNMGSEIAEYTTESLFGPQDLDMDWSVVVASINSGIKNGYVVCNMLLVACSMHAEKLVLVHIYKLVAGVCKATNQWVSCLVFLTLLRNLRQGVEKGIKRLKNAAISFVYCLRRADFVIVYSFSERLLTCGGNRSVHIEVFECHICKNRQFDICQVPWHVISLWSL